MIYACSSEHDGVHQWRGDGGAAGADRPAVHVRAGRDAGALHRRPPPRQRVRRAHAEPADGRELLPGQSIWSLNSELTLYLSLRFGHTI